MTPPRSHLVERAVEAMGGLGPAPTMRPAPPPRPPWEKPALDAVQPVPPPLPPKPPAVSLEALGAAGLVSEPISGRGRVSEEVSVAQNQILRTIVAADRTKPQSRVVLVTSAHPGEGKTFTALNIAASLAAGGSHPVLLMDVDGKPGSLSLLLGLNDTPGLRELAADPTRHPRTLVVETARPRLSVLPYGTSVSGAMPPGTALAAAVRRVAEALPDHIILLDTPPCLSASDPGTLATVSGQVVLVVEAERTQRSEVEAALDLVEACPVLQLLLNKARLTESDTFGAYAEAYASA